MEALADPVELFNLQPHVVEISSYISQHRACLLKERIGQLLDVTIQQVEEGDILLVFEVTPAMMFSDKKCRDEAGSSGNAQHTKSVKAWNTSSAGPFEYTRRFNSSPRTLSSQ